MIENKEVLAQSLYFSVIGYLCVYISELQSNVPQLSSEMHFSTLNWVRYLGFTQINEWPLREIENSTAQQMV